MEQLDSSGTTDDKPASTIQRSSEDFTAETQDNYSATPTATEHRSVPSFNTPVPVSPNAHISHGSHSVPTLRFPRPIGDRRLANWVSSSSPDIMRPGSAFDEEASAADLGYDVISNDGESQVESLASSYIDFPRGDDVQSLLDTDTGTDADTNEVDTESSSDEEDGVDVQHTPAQSAMIRSTIMDTDDEEEDEEDDEDNDNADLVNRSLERPTGFFMPLPKTESRTLAYKSSEHQAGEASEPAVWTEQLHPKEAAPVSISEPAASSTTGRPNKPGNMKPFSLRNYLNMASGLSSERLSFLLIILKYVVGITLVCGVSMVGKNYLMTEYGQTRTLSTVPVASMSSMMATTNVPVEVTTSSSTSTSITMSTALQTTTSNSLIPVSKPQPAGSHTNGKDWSVKSAVFTVELFDKNTIIVKLPRDPRSKVSISKYGLLVAVSRGQEDISTKVSSCDEGLLIEVPQTDAYGVVDVSIASNHKPKVVETFKVNFGSYLLADVFDSGKQFMKGFAQKVVDTVNETTTWVEETCFPTLDLMSKQMNGQTGSVSESIVRGLKEVSHSALSASARLAAQAADRLKQRVDQENIAARVHQVQLELTRQAQDLRDEVSLNLLAASLSSKLWWLKVQGKDEEYELYLAKAPAYLERMKDEARFARHERTEQVKQEIRAHRKTHKHQHRHEGGCKSRFGKSRKHVH